ncbi:MAG: hypothetical protein JWM05_2512, partial [Acidimicrobiales bacterium]|nr:hypothetical protein [Acidimicrobiales bacterium]
MRRNHPVRSSADRPPVRRVGRSRVPLHRRLVHQRRALGHWAVVAMLAVVTGTIVHRLVERARAAETRWGRTEAVVVAARDV